MNSQSAITCFFVVSASKYLKTRNQSSYFSHNLDQSKIAVHIQYFTSSYILITSLILQLNKKILHCILYLAICTQPAYPSCPGLIERLNVPSVFVYLKRIFLLSTRIYQCFWQLTVKKYLTIYVFTHILCIFMQSRVFIHQHLEVRLDILHV